jgi:hypothetical protein
MREKDLTSALLKTLRKIPDSWWYKIPDPARCPKCGVIAMVSKRPFDLIGCVKGYPIAIELKVSNVSHLTPHQKAYLQLFASAGGLSFVYLPGKQYAVHPNGDVALMSKDLYSFLAREL